MTVRREKSFPGRWLQRTAIALIGLWAIADAALAQPAPPTPHVYALIVGVDNYQQLPMLHGAVNDATDLAQSLRAAGARDIVLLRDAEVTRTAVLGAFQRLVTEASADGGWLIFSYAGHGGQEPERVGGDEADGRDEVLLLAGFDTSAPGNGERLVDNELYELFAAVPANVHVLFVVDACHSGTVTRSIDPRSARLGSRNATYGPITNDTLPPPPADSLRREASDLPNVIFVASSLDSETTPEVELGGRPRGAVSWHVARAIGGDADVNGDGETSLSELRQFVSVGVRQVSENRQTPSVQFSAAQTQTDLPFNAPRRPSAPSASQATDPSAPGAPASGSITLWSTGGDTPSIAAVAGAAAAPTRETADLIWDPVQREVINNGLGDLVAQVDAGRPVGPVLAGVVDKWRALEVLRTLSRRAPLDVEIGPRGAGARYASGSVSIRVGNRQGPRYLTLVNLAADGTVQILFPGRRTAGEADLLAPDAAVEFTSEVGAPYGADHIVAIASARDPAPLRASLRAIEGQRAAGDAARLIAGFAGQPGDQIGLVGLYTGSGE